MHTLIHDAAIIGALAAWMLLWSGALVLAADLATRKEH
jgi:hypothetical protein